MKFHIVDATASVCSVVLVGGAVVMGILSKPIPPELAGALGMSLSWLFVRGGVVLKDAEGNGKE